MHSTSTFCTPQTDSHVAFYTTIIRVKNWPNHEENSRHQSEMTWTFICAMFLLYSIFLDNSKKLRGLNHSSCLCSKKTHKKTKQKKQPDSGQPTRPHTKSSAWFSKNPKESQQSPGTGQKIRVEQRGLHVELDWDVSNQVADEEKRLHSQPEQGVVPWLGKKWVAKPWDPGVHHFLISVKG